MRKLFTAVALAALAGGLVAGCASSPSSQSQGGAAGTATTQVPAGDAYRQGYGSEGSAQTTAPTPGGGGQDAVQVNVQGNAFPESTTAAVGQKVVWRNQSQSPHTVTADDGSFNGELQPGGTYEWTPSRPGRVPYHCTYHPGMEGVVVVT